MRLLLLLAVLLSFLVAPAPLEAAEALRMTVRPGLDGMVKLGVWFPIEVQVSNTGADVAGEIQVQVDGIENRGAFNRPAVVYGTPASLPRQSNKRFVVEVYLPSPVDKISARLVSNGTTLVQADAPFERVGQNEVLCGVLSGNRNALDFLPSIDQSGRHRRIRVAHLDLIDLPPSPQLLSSLDCMIVSNISLAGLPESQQNALRAWVAAGGLLVVAGGPGWQKTLAGLPPNLLPVEVVGTIPLRGASTLEGFIGEPLEDPGPWLIAESRPTDGAVIIAEGELPLVVAARRGQGAVVFLALDPSLEPLRSWRGSPQLWRYLTSYMPGQLQLPSNFIRQYVGWGRPPRSALADLSPLRPPSSDFVSIILVMYALAVGPFAYLALRRLGRLEWLLWLAPVLTAVAAAAAFGSARTSSESDILFNKISVIHAWDTTADGYSRTYVSAFSPREGTYTIDATGQTVPADALVFPLFNPFPAPTGTPTPGTGTLAVQRSGSTAITNFALEARSLGTFTIDARAPMDPGVIAKLTLANGTVTGTIANGPQRVANAALVLGNDVVRLGDLAPGEQRQIVASINDGSPIGYQDLSTLVKQLYPNPSIATPVSTGEAMSREILESALNSNFTFASRVDLAPVALVGWLDKSPIRLQARNARTAELDRTLLVAALVVGIQPGEDLRIPSTLIERRNLVAGSGRVTQNGITLSAGEALLFEYVLPQRPDRFALDEVSLDVRSSPLGNGPLPDVAQLAVYDWPRADWTEIPIAAGVVPLGERSRIVSALGQIRVRLTYKPPAGGSTTQVLTIDRLDLVARGRGR